MLPASVAPAGFCQISGHGDERGAGKRQCSRALYLDCRGWNQADQRQPLSDDVRNVAEVCLDHLAPLDPMRSRTLKRLRPAHRPGAVVVQQQRTAPAEIEKLAGLAVLT